MEKISLCMITKNEAQNIRRCLNSVKDIVYEMIVVDTGSDDDTPQIAQDLGAKVYSFEWRDDFSAARNFSLEKATGDWILFLDADEELAKESAAKLLEIVKNKDITGFFLKIINYIGKDGGLETSPDIVFRLFRNSQQYRFHGVIHEQIADTILQQTPEAKYQTCEEVVILHYGYTEKEISSKDKKQRNLRILAKELEANPKDYLLRYHYGVELFRNEQYENAANELMIAAQNTNPSTYIFPKLLRYIVMSLFNVHKYLEAEQFCKKALQYLPDYADLYYFQGLILFEEKKYASAFESFNKALSSPEQPAYYASFSGTRGYRSKYQCGKIAEMFLNLEAALTFYVSALRENPFFIVALEEIIKILNPRRETDYTRECINKMFRFENNRALIDVANIFYRQRGYVLALEFINKIDSSLQENDDIKMMKAVCHMQAREELPALRLLKSFPPESSLYPIALTNLFFCYWLQDKKKLLREVMQKLFALGISSETAAVIKLFRDCLYKRSTEKVTLQGDSIPLFLDLFTRTADLGCQEKIDKLLNKLSAESTEKLSWEIGRILFEHGYALQAEEYLLIALEHNPDDKQILYTLGENYELLGRKNTAVQYYRKGVADKTAEPKFYIKLINLYQEMLKETLEKAALIYPNAKKLKELLAETGNANG